MVNETDKPQKLIENEQLGQRLAASNQALAEMQAEHHQLLEEMEQLRRRAEDLQRLREEQESEEQERMQQHQNSITATTVTNVVGHVDEEPRNVVKIEEETKEENDEVVTDPKEADYIQEKLAEIASLKAQFKRVQHIINTTEMIENHINKKENILKAVEESTKPKTSEGILKNKKTDVTDPTIATSNIIESTPVPNMPSMADLNAASTSDEKEQLLLTMLNMFQDFSSDLKSQADNLRAERERIKELKESIIKSRQQKPK